jgi:hypothetical protein
MPCQWRGYQGRDFKPHTEAHGKIMLVRHENESTLKRIRLTEDGKAFLCWEDGSGRTEEVVSEDYEVQGEYIFAMHR